MRLLFRLLTFLKLRLAVALVHPAAIDMFLLWTSPGRVHPVTASVRLLPLAVRSLSAVVGVGA